MPSLIELRDPAPTDPPGACRMVPHAYDEAARVQVRAMPGVRWLALREAPNGRGLYVGPREACDAVCATLTAARVAVVRDRRSSPAHHPDEPAPVPPGLPAALRPYQVAGAAWVVAQVARTGAALLADEMGIGKTPQAIAAIDALARADQLPARVVVVVCPAIVVPHWGAELERWAAQGPEGLTWRVLSYEGFQRAVKGGTKKIPSLPAQVGALVVDECHYLSNSRAARSRAVATWLHGCTVRPRVVLLSGTPMTAEPADLWHPLDVGWPGRFGAFWDFTRRYCGGRWVEIEGVERPVWSYEGVTHAPELAARLRHYMLRRTKHSVAVELPPLTRVVHEVELPAAARKSLRAAALAIDWTGHGAQRAGVSSLLSEVESYKVGAACALAAEALACGSRVLLLTTRKSTARELGLQLRAPVADGDVDVADRRALIADAPCAVATIYSVTTGINLTGFDQLIMVGLDWLPSTLLQGEARVHRISQERPVTITYLVGRGTLDEVVRERVLSRLGIEADVLGASSDGLADGLAGGSEEELLAGLVASIAGGRA